MAGGHRASGWAESPYAANMLQTPSDASVWRNRTIWLTDHLSKEGEAPGRVRGGRCSRGLLTPLLFELGFTSQSVKHASMIDCRRKASESTYPTPPIAARGWCRQCRWVPSCWRIQRRPRLPLSASILSHHSRTRWSGGRYPLSPGLMSNAAYQPSSLRTTPFTR